MKKLLIVYLFAVICALAQQPGQKPAAQIIYASSLPAVCNPALGQVYFKTAATIGMYQCLTLNTWTLMGSAASPGEPNGTCSFTAAATCSITGLTGVAALAAVSCYDNSGSLVPLIPQDFIGTTADTLVINFATAQTGYCNASTGVGATGATGATGPAGAAGPISATGGSDGQLQYKVDATTLGGTADGSYDSTAKLSSFGNLNLTTVTAPSTALTAAVAAPAGNPNGTYTYYVTFGIGTPLTLPAVASGQSNASSVSNSISPASKQVTLTGIPVSTNPRVTHRVIWRVTGSFAAGPYPVLTISDNTTTIGTDNTVDGTTVTDFQNYTSGLFVDGLPMFQVIDNGDFGDPTANHGVILIGPYAGGSYPIRSAMGVDDSVFIGGSSGYSCVFCFNDVGIGDGALFSLTTGQNNVAIGDNTGQTLSTGSLNSYYGRGAGWGNGSGDTGDQNTFLGAQSGLYNNSGNLTGSNNTGGGFAAFGQLTGVAANNTAWGASSCVEITTGAGVICLGANSGPTANQSNKLFIDNSKTDTPLIGGDFSAHTLAFQDSGGTTFNSLTGTGAATGKTVVCADTNGKLYRSTSGVACAN